MFKRVDWGVALLLLAAGVTVALGQDSHPAPTPRRAIPAIRQRQPASLKGDSAAVFIVRPAVTNALALEFVQNSYFFSFSNCHCLRVCI
jgi:hypothetical protein